MVYLECKRYAPDFQLRVEVWDRGRQVSATGTVRGELVFVDQERLTGSPLGDVLALHNLLLRMHKILREAHNGAA